MTMRSADSWKCDQTYCYHDLSVFARAIQRNALEAAADWADRYRSLLEINAYPGAFEAGGITAAERITEAIESMIPEEPKP